MIKKIALVFFVAFSAFFAGGLFLPATVHVERSIDIARPVGTVFTVLNGFEVFAAWSPWDDRDSGIQYRVSGPREGVGARMEWTGDPRQVGTGWMEITESRPNSRIATHLFLEQQGEADTKFQIERIAGGSRLTWSFDADLVEGQGLFGGVLSRYFGLFFDRWIGGDFSRGLNNLKNYVESIPAADFSAIDIRLLDIEPQDILYVPGIATGGSQEVASALAEAYRELSVFMAANELQRLAQPMTITRSLQGSEMQFEAAIPVGRLDVPASGNVRWGRSPGGPAARVVHRGRYDDMAASYEKLAAWMAAHGYREGTVSWEHYISDPGETPPDELITHIYFTLAAEP